MFKKFAGLENRTERLEIFNLIKFNLTTCLRLMEFLSLALLLFGLGWLLSGPFTADGLFPGALLAIFLMLLAVSVARLPFVWAVSALLAAFSLDPRPAKSRLAALARSALHRGAVIWLITVILLWGLAEMNLWVWTLSTLGFGAALILGEACFPRLWRPEKLRPPREGELPPSLLARLDHWTAQTGLPRCRLMISSDFDTELRPPRLSGLGPTLTLIISEKALAAFPPREMEVLVVAAVIGALIKAPLKMLLLRFCALAVAVPLAAILISTLGASWWAYPLVTSPALVALIWLAAWIGAGAAELTGRLTHRALAPQLAAAATVILKDEEALVRALMILAERNLEEESPPAWREMFRCRPSRAAFLKRAHYHRHLAQFKE